MKIKILVFFLAFALVLTSCGQLPTVSEAESQEPTESTQTQSQEPTESTQTISSATSQDDKENDMENNIPEKTILVKYPEIPADKLPRDYDYTVRVIQGNESFEIPVYNPVYASDYFNRDLYNWDQHRRYAEFAFSGDPVTVEITVHNNFKSYTVMPSSKAIPSKINGNVITYTIDKPCTTVLKLNNDKDTHLTIFAEKPETNVPDKNGKNVVYFEAGYHEIEGGVLNVGDDTTVYLEAGALVKARLDVNGKNVHVYGNGAFIESSPTRMKVANTSYMCMVNGSENLLIENVRFLDAHTFNIVTVDGKNLKFDGVKVLSNQVSTDGFSIWSGANGVHFDNCYFNISDNVFVIGGGLVENFLVENTMIITDYAFLFPQGNLEGDPLVFKNIDVLRYGSFMKHEYPEYNSRKAVQLVLENCTAIDNDRGATVLKITYGIDSIKNYVFKNVSLPELQGSSLLINSDDCENATLTFDNVWLGKTVVNENTIKLHSNMNTTTKNNAITITDTKDESAVCLTPNTIKLDKEVKVYRTFVGARKLETKYKPYEKDGVLYVSAYEILEALAFEDIKVSGGKLTFSYDGKTYEAAVADEKAMLSTTDLANLIRTRVAVEGMDIKIGNIERTGNLLRAGDFENGLSMNWVTRNFTRLALSDDGHDSKHAIRVYEYQWGADGGIYQDIAETLRQYGTGEYEITAWVKKASADCDSKVVGLGVTDEWSVTKKYTTIPLTDEWQQITMEYNYSGDPEKLLGMILCIGYADGSVRDILIDDVSMVKVG